MATIKLASNLKWTSSPYAPPGSGWERTGLFNDRVHGDAATPGRGGKGDYTTAVRNAGPGDVQLTPFPFEWELFLYQGDAAIDGAQISPGDHCTIAVGEKISVRTVKGCQYLVIARTAR